MNVDALVPWTPDFASRSPMYDVLRPLADAFADFPPGQWPSLGDLQNFLLHWPEPIMTLGGRPLTVVEQDGKPTSFEQHYAPRIYLTGEIQTRHENWHDFFQLLTWCMFPNTKAVINAIHLPAARQRLAEGGEPGRRTAIENTLSLFDEGGAVIVSSDESLLQLVRDFEWKRLFWQRRAELASTFQCVTFGHAMFEKGLAPYIGMTANCILLSAEADYFALPLKQQWAWVDQQLAALFSEGKRFQKPKDLQPFPILGMPGWDRANDQASYYENSRYFRPGRLRQAR